MCLSFILGVSLASFYKEFPLFFYTLILLAAILFITIWWEVRVIKIIGFCLLFFLWGISRFVISLPQENSDQLQTYNEQEIIVEGVVAAEPDIRLDTTKLTINSRQGKQDLKDDWSDITGQVLITVPRFPQYKYGDLLQLKCKLQTPAEFDDFSYKNYLAKYDIYSVCYYPEVKLLDSDQGNIVLSNIFVIKDKANGVFKKILTEPEASFLSGMILGIKRGIPEDLIESFNVTGTSHVIVISGLHITIVAGLLMYLAQGVFSLPRKYAFWVAVIGLILFILLTGARPSSIRAGIMGGLVLLAMNVGRVSDSKNAILLAASIMLLINPKILRFDMGFQLSFLATIGIIYLSPYLEKLLKFLPKIFKIREVATMTLAAQVLTLPVIIYNFERISIISPVVNILVVPLIPITVTTGFISLILGFIWYFIGKIFAFVPLFLLQYELFIVDLFSKIPYASLEVEKIWIGWIIIYYTGIALFILNIKRKERLALMG